MKIQPKDVSKWLNQAIRFVSKHSSDYVHRPGVDFSRKRKLTMDQVIKFLLVMGSKSLPSELKELTNFSLDAPSVSAFVQARDKLTVEALSTVFERFMSHKHDIKLFKGYQLLAHDGSDLIVPTDPDIPTTINGNRSQDFSLLHLNAFYDVLSKLYIEIDYQHKRKSDERQSLCEMVDTMTFKNPSIIIADRGYESNNVCEHIRHAGQKFVIRTKDIKSTGLLSSLKLPDSDTFDTTVSYKLTRLQTKEVKSNPEYHTLMNKSKFDYLPKGSKASYDITLRVLRFEISPGSYECLVTNLSPEDFSKDDLKELYHLRWGIETSFRELKYALGLVNLHSKKLDAIYKEIFARLIMYNFSMMITIPIEINQANRKYGYQVNYTQAIGACRAFYRDTKIQIEELIKKYILPIRPGRHDKRDKTKSYARRRRVPGLYRQA
jgi:hypothetical protein